MRALAVILALSGVEGLVAVSAGAEELIDVRTAPCITWTATTGQTYTIERAAAVTGTWTTAATVYSPTSGPTAWADPSGSPAAYYRLSHYFNTSHTLAESFEDAGGWTDHPAGNWTNWGTTGKWAGKGCVATSAPTVACSPVRCIRFNADGQRLYFPAGGLVTQLLVWYRGSQEMSQQACFRLVGNDGSQEFQISHIQQVDTTAWTSRTWTITSPETWAFYYIDTFWTYSPIYLDDVIIRY